MGLIFPALAAFLYACSSFLSRRALDEGAGLLRQAFVTNQVFLVAFGLFAWMDPAPPQWNLVLWPILTGFFFFLGQGFTFAAIRSGDVSLQTPLMGTKSLFVVILAILLGAEALDITIVLSAAAVGIGVLLLALPKNVSAEKRRVTVVLALVSSASFAVSDVLVAAHAAAFGPRAFLAVAMAVCAGLSYGMFFFFREPLTHIPRQAWRWVGFSAGGMALQAILLNFYIAFTANVAEANIIYSTRGLWSVVLAIFLAGNFVRHSDVLTREMVGQRLVGAVFMMLSIILLFV